MTSSSPPRSTPGARAPTPTWPSPSTPHPVVGTANVGLVTTLLDHLAITPPHTTAFLCGPEVMIRVVARNLVDAGVDADRILRLARAEHALRGAPVRPLPARTALHLRRRPGRHLGRRRARCWRCDDGEQHHPTDPRGVEVRLVRRMPALPARLRGRTAGRRRSGAGRLLPRGNSSDGRRAVRPLARRRLDHHRGRRRRDQGHPRGVAAPRDDRCLRHGRRDPGTAQLRRCRRLRADRLRHTVLHLDARHVDADQRPRPGRLRTARLPDRQVTSCST